MQLKTNSECGQMPKVGRGDIVVGDSQALLEVECCVPPAIGDEEQLACGCIKMRSDYLPVVTSK